MPVQRESIQVGHCYLGDNGKVWRIVRIWPDDRVQFEFRARFRGDARVWKPGMVDRASFAASAQCEVPCDWRPGTDGQRAPAALSFSGVRRA
jgi:hypothetical protein